MNDRTVEVLLRTWLADRFPTTEGVGSSGHLGEVWAELQRIVSVEEIEGGIRVDFVWSEHRVSELTGPATADEPDPTLQSMHEETLRFGHDGSLI